MGGITVPSYKFPHKGTKPPTIRGRWQGLELSHRWTSTAAGMEPLGSVFDHNLSYSLNSLKGVIGDYIRADYRGYPGGY